MSIPRASEELTALHSGAAPARARADRWAFWAGAALVVALTAATFLPMFQNDFVNWDDLDNFLRNPNYRGLGWANLRWMFTTAQLGHYVPVTWLTLGLDYVLWGMNPWGYHLTALVLHAINALLLYLLAYRLLERGFALPGHHAHSPGEGDGAHPAPSLDGWESKGEWPDARSHEGALRLGAMVAALLFSVHPLRVESVAWITERRDLLAGLFSLLTVLAYLRAHRRGRAGYLHRGWYWSAVGLFVGALLSKSIVVGLPLVLLALDIYPLRRTRRLLGLLGEKGPFLLASASVSGSMFAIGVRHELFTPFITLGVFDRLAISAYGLVFYLWKTLVPWRLSPLYELHYPIRPLAATYLVPSILVLAISGAAIAARRRWPAGLTIWAVYVVLLLPVLGILQNGHQIAADRYTYLACLGWAVIAGAGVTWSWRAKETNAVTPGPARLVLALSASAIIACAALSTLQVRVWRDSETLWHHAVSLDPGSAFAHYHLGGALSVFGRHEEAIAEYGKAVSLFPDVLDTKAMFYVSLGLELQKKGDLAGAERSYRAALRHSQVNVTALNNLGVIYALRGEDRAALDSFLRVLRIFPGHDSACANAYVLSLRFRTVPPELERCLGDATGEGPSPSPVFKTAP